MRQAHISSIGGEESKAQEAFLIRFETSQTLPRLGAFPAPLPHHPFSGVVMSANREFSSTQIDKVVSTLPEATQKKILKVKKSKKYDVASLWTMLNRTAGSKTALVIMDMLIGVAPALKDGGKIKRKPARKSKIAKVMKSRKRKKK